MQIAMRRRSPCSSGAGPTLWERYRQDGDGDGHAERFDFADAVATAALVLRTAKGAPPTGGSAAGYRRAACAYYGACSDAAVPYADQVMARATVSDHASGHAADIGMAANDGGHLDWREWQSQDGSKRQAIQIIADTIQFLGAPQHAPNDQPHNRATGATVTSDDDIPF
jgi:hypothetical protein